MSTTAVVVTVVAAVMAGFPATSVFLKPRGSPSPSPPTTSPWWTWLGTAKTTGAGSSWARPVT
ncbi:hypothetical protein [Streptomyces sp. NPDC006551]|uniref:hypothetical protein n=1 Tax=Streptomyces sp. NPDC006551 TaxID=3157178 RepID=UPI00339F810A